MTDTAGMADQFEQNRGRLRAVAYRMLGSSTEADDAVQEAWLRLSRSNAAEIENLGRWLTTVTARVCLDMLRARQSRREDSIDAEPVAPPTSSKGTLDPEREAVLADSVGLALLVILDRLAPAERLAFVLHDMFGMSFEEIAGIVGRTATATRQLASRARRRVQGAPASSGVDLRGQREVVDAFLGALRAGDVDGLVAVLDPDVVVHIDQAAGGPGAAREIHGAREWARGAVAFAAMSGSVRPVLVNGSVGLVMAPHGHLMRAVAFTFAGGKIVEADIIADPIRLRTLDIALAT
ncbi:MAG: sigma-70 family RNA polymerase sigma factor [Candidatus Acidiferrales bacterium]